MIDTQKELKAILSHVSKTWDGVDPGTINQVWDKALELNKNSIDIYGFNGLIRTLILTPLEVNGVKITSDLNYALMDFENWERNQYLEKEVTFETLSELINKDARPKNWYEISNSYTREKVEKFVASQFFEKYQGTKKKFDSLQFDELVALDHVMYYDKEQGYTPNQSLCSAIMSQARYIMKQNNTLQMLKEWKSDIGQFKNPLNIALLELLDGNKNTSNFENILNAGNKKKIKP